MERSAELTALFEIELNCLLGVNDVECRRQHDVGPLL